MPSKLKLTTLPQKPAAFIEPMDCLAVTKLPDSANWVWEIKIDGYRAIAVKNGDRANLYSRTMNLFNSKFSYVVEALSDVWPVIKSDANSSTADWDYLTALRTYQFVSSFFHQVYRGGFPQLGSDCKQIIT